MLQHKTRCSLLLSAVLAAVPASEESEFNRGPVLIGELAVRRNAVMHSPLGGFDRSIKELRTNAQFSATMNVNAFVESLKQQLAARMSRRAADGHGGAGGGAEQLLTIVEEVNAFTLKIAAVRHKPGPLIVSS